MWTRIKNSMSFRWMRLRCRHLLPHYYTIDGWLLECEAVALYDLARKLPPASKIIEIGSWQGKSTYCLARGLRNGRIIVIDPFNGRAGGDIESETLFQKLIDEQKPDLLSRFKENMKRAGVSSLIDIWQGYSQDHVGKTPRCDLLFIDGDHSIEGCKFDYQNYAPMISPGGYLVFHDYYPDRETFGPTWVIHNLVLPSGEFEKAKVDGHLWIGQRHMNVNDRC
jgi:hypothetical protein